MNPDTIDGKLQLALIILSISAPILTFLFAWSARKLNGLIDAKTKNENVGGMLARANDLIWTLVKEAQQTVVEGIKDARKPESQGGTDITKDELEAVKEAVINNFKKLWGVTGLAELAKVLGLESDALDSWIGSKIEAAVHDLKAENPQ